METTRHVIRLQSLEFRKAGLSIVPLRLDGTKVAKIPWATYQTRLPTPGEIEHWFQQDAGAAIVCGVVSGGLEVLDFDVDAKEIFPQWSAMVDPILAGLPVVETPSGGFHVHYRCHQICGNTKIAVNDANQVLIESRGQGGYVVTVISPAEVHNLNCPYVQVGGPVLPEVPTITPKQRKHLWKAALSFDRSGILERRKTVIAPSRLSHRVSNSNQFVSARRYVEKMEPAISGANGHNKTYKVACRLVQLFGLSQEDSLSILMEYNQRCKPRWTERELLHKLQSASK